MFCHGFDSFSVWTSCRHRVDGMPKIRCCCLLTPKSQAPIRSSMAHRRYVEWRTIHDLHHVTESQALAQIMWPLFFQTGADGFPKAHLPAAGAQRLRCIQHIRHRPVQCAGSDSLPSAEAEANKSWHVRSPGARRLAGQSSGNSRHIGSFRLAVDREHHSSGQRNGCSAGWTWQPGKFVQAFPDWEHVIDVLVFVGGPIAD